MKNNKLKVVNHINTEQQKPGKTCKDIKQQILREKKECVQGIKLLFVVDQILEHLEWNQIEKISQLLKHLNLKDKNERIKQTMKLYKELMTTDIIPMDEAIDIKGKIGTFQSQKVQVL